MVTEQRNCTAPPPKDGAKIDLYYGASIHPDDFAISVDPWDLMNPDMGGELRFDPEEEPERALEAFLYVETVQARTFASHVMHPKGTGTEQITAVWKSEKAHLVGTATVEHPPEIRIEKYQDLMERGAKQAKHILEKQGFEALMAWLTGKTVDRGETEGAK